jgi:hypothetical protein
MAVDRIVGGVEIEDNLLGRLLVRFQEEVPRVQKASSSGYTLSASGTSYETG